MQEKKVMTIQDFSSFGQCSISVALPILSAMGNETVALPVTLLSTHTSEFKDYTLVDLSDNLLKSAEHIKRYNPDFDVIYTGYLGTSATVAQTLEILKLFPSAKIIVDPAMAESGKLYDGIQNDYVDSVLKLCQESYICLPNFTEACMLAGKEYTSTPDDDFLRTLCRALFSSGINTFAVTGIDNGDSLCVIVGEQGKIRKYSTPKITGKYYGAGDVFSSVVAGAIAQGKTVEQAVMLAMGFTGKAVLETSKDKSHWYGLKFEKFLPLLSKNL